MDALANLQAYLTRAKVLLADQPAPLGRPEEMAKAVETMRARVATGRATISRDRIREALALLATRGAKAACDSHLRYLCWSLWEPFGQSSAMAREDRATEQILDAAGAELRQGLLPLSAWRGLLAAYLTPPKKPVGEPQSGNWIRLREFLAATLPKVSADARFRPDWLVTMNENREILSDAPCSRYAPAIAEGDTTTIDDIRHRLAVPEESWFWKELILSRVRHLLGQDDQSYLSGLKGILKALADHPSLADDALTMLLPRHFNGLADRAHSGLQDYAVKYWGSPNIFSQAKWSLVNAAVKQMVREWLVKEDLRDFFSILQADHAADQRRLNFWLDYAKQIDFAHFVLGSATWNSPRADYVEMRRRKSSRIAQLIDGTATNNAFILKLGNYFFVEFGETGNACYMYEAGNLPFDARRHHQSINDLKNKHKAIAHPSHVHEWEVRYRQQLANFGIYPDKEAQTASRRLPIRPSQTKAATPSQGWAEHAEKIARQYSIKIVDQRSKGGCLWLLTGSSTHPAASELNRLGFKYMDNRGFWRKR